MKYTKYINRAWYGNNGSGGGGGGGCCYEYTTVAALQALKTASGLVAGTFYQITDVNGDWQVVLLAESTNQISTQGQGIFQNVLFTEAWYDLDTNTLLRIYDPLYNNDIEGANNISLFTWNSIFFYNNSIINGSTYTPAAGFTTFFNNTINGSVLDLGGSNFNGDFYGNIIESSSIFQLTGCSYTQVANNYLNSSTLNLDNSFGYEITCNSLTLQTNLFGLSGASSFGDGILFNSLEGAYVDFGGFTTYGGFTYNSVNSSSLLFSNAIVYDYVRYNNISKASQINAASGQFTGVQFNNLLGGCTIDVSTSLGGYNVQFNNLANSSIISAYGSFSNGITGNDLTNGSRIDAFNVSTAGTIRDNVLEHSTLTIDPNWNYDQYANWQVYGLEMNYGFVNLLDAGAYIVAALRVSNTSTFTISSASSVYVVANISMDNECLFNIENGSSLYVVAYCDLSNRSQFIISATSVANELQTIYLERGQIYLQNCFFNEFQIIQAVNGAYLPISNINVSNQFRDNYISESNFQVSNWNLAKFNYNRILKNSLLNILNCVDNEFINNEYSNTNYDVDGFVTNNKNSYNTFSNTLFTCHNTTIANDFTYNKITNCSSICDFSNCNITNIKNNIIDNTSANCVNMTFSFGFFGNQITYCTLDFTGLATANLYQNTFSDSTITLTSANISGEIGYNTIESNSNCNLTSVAMFDSFSGNIIKESNVDLTSANIHEMYANHVEYSEITVDALPTTITGGLDNNYLISSYLLFHGNYENINSNKLSDNSGLVLQGNVNNIAYNSLTSASLLYVTGNSTQLQTINYNDLSANSEIRLSALINSLGSITNNTLTNKSQLKLGGTSNFTNIRYNTLDNNSQITDSGVGGVNIATIDKNTISDGSLLTLNNVTGTLFESNNINSGSTVTLTSSALNNIKKNNISSSAISVTNACTLTNCNNNSYTDSSLTCSLSNITNHNNNVLDSNSSITINQSTITSLSSNSMQRGSGTTIVSTTFGATVDSNDMFSSNIQLSSLGTPNISQNDLRFSIIDFSIGTDSVSNVQTNTLNNSTISSLGNSILSKINLNTLSSSQIYFRNNNFTSANTMVQNNLDSSYIDVKDSVVNSDEISYNTLTNQSYMKLDGTLGGAFKYNTLNSSSIIFSGELQINRQISSNYLVNSNIQISTTDIVQGDILSNNLNSGIFVSDGTLNLIMGAISNNIIGNSSISFSNAAEVDNLSYNTIDNNSVLAFDNSWIGDYIGNLHKCVCYISYVNPNYGNYYNNEFSGCNVVIQSGIGGSNMTMQDVNGNLSVSQSGKIAQYGLASSFTYSLDLTNGSVYNNVTQTITLTAEQQAFGGIFLISAAPVGTSTIKAITNYPNSQWRCQFIKNTATGTQRFTETGVGATIVLGAGSGANVDLASIPSFVEFQDVLSSSKQYEVTHQTY